MTEVEKQENEALKKCLKGAYGYSDQQLLKEMEEAEQSLNDSDFPGAEERIYKKIMEREAAEKKAADMGVPDGKKVVRLGKRKVFLVAILAAAFVGLLGLTAVGEKSYFFRMREKEAGLVFNNGDNIQEVSNLERAYDEIENALDIQILKMGYIPSTMEVEEVLIDDDRSEIRFDYKGNSIYYIQIKKYNETSVGVNSGRKEKRYIWNDWLKKEITYRESCLAEGQTEYEAQIVIQEVLYLFYGKMELGEFENVVKNLNFY